MNLMESLQRAEDVKFEQQRPDCLDALTDRERYIWVARNSECEYQRQTFEQLAKRYDISRERIRQLEASAFMKIREFREQNLRKCEHCQGKGWV